MIMYHGVTKELSVERLAQSCEMQMPDAGF